MSIGVSTVHIFLPTYVTQGVVALPNVLVRVP
jgi:hypothetical protein